MLASASLLGSAEIARATGRGWTGATSENWFDSGNWNPGPWNNDTADFAVFDNPGNRSINVNAPVTLAGMRFLNLSNQVYGPHDLTFVNGLNGDISVTNAAVSADIFAPISGSVPMNVNISN